jgi:hypothetical protein
MLTPLSKVPTTNGQAPAPRIVTGQYLAKAVNYPKWYRASDAARWLRGELAVKPTLKLAAETFGVSVPLVAAARERFEQQERSKHHGNGGTSALSDSAIDNIVREVGPERVMCSLDRITTATAAVQSSSPRLTMARKRA